MSTALPASMKVVAATGPGGPEVLQLTERPLPKLESGELLVKVAAAGVNGPDIWQRKGLYPPPAGATDLLGLEISGEVVARGDQVARWKVGDRICALTNGGGYAQYCTVDARHCLPVPGGVSLRDAGGLPETFFTVWSNIFMGAGLAAGETLLVHGGAGGIGTTAIQLARTFGARVIATDSPEERCAVCRDLGMYLVNSVNPFRLEGQKSIMFRVLEALRWEVPDWIVVPGGNLGNSSAFGKAFHELHQLGLIERMPRFAALGGMERLVGHESANIGNQPGCVTVTKADAATKSLDGIIDVAGARTDIDDRQAHGEI